MPNVLTQNPLIIDTAATIAFTRPVLARFIEWVGPATVGNSCVITDLPGNTMATGVCSVVNQAVTLWPGPIRLILPGKSGKPNGSWTVSVINSGKLYVWY